MTTEAEQRAAFEAWATAPPYEREVERFDAYNKKECACPGQYRDIAVQLAWEAWQASWQAALGKVAGLCRNLYRDDILLQGAQPILDRVAAQIEALATAQPEKRDLPVERDDAQPS